MSTERDLKICMAVYNATFESCQDGDGEVDFEPILATIPPEPVAVPEGWRDQVEQAISRASVFDDGSDGADAESARSVVGILSAMLAAAPLTKPLSDRIAANEFADRVVARLRHIHPRVVDIDLTMLGMAVREVAERWGEPQPWVQQPSQALTDDQIWHEWVVACDTVGGSVAIAFARAIEARLK